jgi:hypothetical protein
LLVSESSCRIAIVLFIYVSYTNKICLYQYQMSISLKINRTIGYMCLLYLTIGPSWSYGNLDLQLPVQSVPITTKVVSSNPVHGEVYSIQHYVIKYVSDLWQVNGFLLVLRYFSTNKTDHHDITEILLKVPLNTINQPI